MASGGGRGTITPCAGFSAEAEAQALRKAMKGLGTDEKAIINSLVKCSNEQRQEIIRSFKTQFGKDLIKDLKSELGGHFEDAVLGFMMRPAEYDAFLLQNAVKGIGTNEAVLTEVMCSRTNAELRAIKAEYQSNYGKELERDLAGDTGGHYKRLMVSLCQASRDESPNVDVEKAKEDAQKLHKAGEGKLGTDESQFNVILATRSYKQLCATFDQYAKIAQRDILNSLDREMSGDLRDAMKAVAQVARNKPAYFAELIYKSMKGMGTDDDMLIRLIISRAEVDLQDIKEEFMREYKKSIYKWLEGEISGDYRRFMMAIVGPN